MSDKTWQPNKLGISDDMVIRAAAEFWNRLPGDWTLGLSVEEFGDDALAILTEGLRGTRWEDGL